MLIKHNFQKGKNHFYIIDILYKRFKRFKRTLINEGTSKMLTLIKKESLIYRDLHTVLDKIY